MEGTGTPNGTGTPASEGGGIPPELQGATGAGAQLGWRAQLPDDLKNHEAFTGYKSIGDLAKTYLETTGKVSDLEGRLANSIPRPGENATPAEMAAYFTKLGRPETPEQYTFEPHGLPDGVMDPTIEAWFRKAAFDTGLNNVQAGTLYKQYMDMLGQKYTETMAARERVREEALTKLYAEWGDKRAENIETIKRALKQFGDSELGKYFDETGKGNDPVLINFLLKVGKAMSEDTFVKGSQSQGMQRKIDPGTGMPVFDYPSMQENNSGG